VPKLGIVNRLGTINTIVRQEGFLVSDNADYGAIANCLDRFHNLKSAAVLGTGSLAQTVLHYLLRRNLAATMLTEGTKYNHSKSNENRKFLS